MGWLNRFFNQKMNIDEAREWFLSSRQSLDPVVVSKFNTLFGEFDDVQNRRKELNIVLSSLNESLSMAVSEGESLKLQKESLTSSSQYQDMRSQVLSAVSAREAAAKEIRALFSPFSEELKKYGKSIDNPLISRYGDDPIDALIHDFSLHITDHLSSLRLSIERNPFKNVDAGTLNSLKLITKENLGRLLHAFANARKSEERIKDSLGCLPVIQEFERLSLLLKENRVKQESLKLEMSAVALPSLDPVISRLAVDLKGHKIDLV